MYRGERRIGSEQVTQARSGDGRRRTKAFERGVVCIAADGREETDTYSWESMILNDKSKVIYAGMMMHRLKTFAAMDEKAKA